MIEDLEKTIQYIENNLLEDLKIKDISKNVGISEFYLQRSFQILTGYSIGEYIRNRRLYLAAREISKDNCKIIDIAYKYGYETPESFTKAFSKFHNNTPSQVRNGAEFVPFNKIRVKITLEQGEEMNVKIVPMFPIKLIGFEKEFNFENSKQEIPKFWDEVCEKYFAKIYQGLDPETAQEKAVVDYNIGEYAICLDDGAAEKFNYMIAGKYVGGEVPEGMKVVELEKGDWAIFDCFGPNPDTLQETTSKIYGEWIPNNKEYEVREKCSIEWYDTITDMKDSNYHSAIWIPVKKK